MYSAGQRIPWGGWRPIRLGAGIIRAWYDETTALESNSWDDRSGNSRHQGVAAGVFNIGNSRKGRRYTYLIGDVYSSAAFVNAQPFTIFFACKFGAWGTTAALMDGVGTTVRVQRQAADQILIYASTNLTATFSSSLTNRWVAIAAVFNGANSAIYENGILRASGDVGATNPTGLNLGAANGGGSLLFTGEIGEVMPCAGSLTETLIKRESNYLCTKWV